jgi:AraC-like DNA-binding protein
MDPLSDVFVLLDVKGARCTRLEAAGKWAFRFPAKPSLKFVALLRGQCWLTLPSAAPLALSAGDTFLLSNAPAYEIASDLQRKARDGILSFDWARANVARHGGDETVLLGGSFEFGGASADLLLAALPAFIHIPGSDHGAAVLRSTLQLLDAELQSQQMGASVMVSRMGEISLVQALRAYVAREGVGATGWLGAISDPRIGAALSLIHDNPGHRWTVKELASAAGISRSGFALRFKALVGLPPLDYLTRWRMQRAHEALRRNEGSVASLAAALGYSSESAFGHAFKRAFGHAPKRFGSGEPP